MISSAVNVDRSSRRRSSSSGRSSLLRRDSFLPFCLWALRIVVVCWACCFSIVAIRRLR